MSNNNETQSSALPSQRPDNVPVLPAASNEFASQQPETADEREQRTVHDVYETIAPHFSRTRYKVRSMAAYACHESFNVRANSSLSFVV